MKQTAAYFKLTVGKREKLGVVLNKNGVVSFHEYEDFKANSRLTVDQCSCT